VQAGRGTGDFFLSGAFGPNLGPIRSPIQSVPVALCAEVKRPELEPDHFCIVVSLRICGAVPPYVICLHGLHEDNFIFL
jgi:hypothetical protein